MSSSWAVELIAFYILAAISIWLGLLSLRGGVRFVHYLQTEAAKALRSAPKEEPPQREQQKSDRAEPPKTTTVTARPPENKPAAENEALLKKGTRARERVQESSAFRSIPVS